MTTRPRAVLVAVQTPDQSDAVVQASLAELERLCDTLGFDVVGQVTQRRSGRGSARLLGDGKLHELAAWTAGTGVVHRGPTKKKKSEDDDEVDDGPDALDLTILVDLDDQEPDAPVEEEAEDLWEAVDSFHDDDSASQRRADTVVVDADLSPSQLRNLQSATGVEVLDRTGVILEIFHRNARTREARLQVEIARLNYLAPRLREVGGPSERMAGQGAGESDLELDRRRVRDRIAQLRRELETIERERGQRRARRRTARQVALVGYTNAGKSSLMRALTGSEPYVADKLFATLDTTVRRLHPEAIPPVLVTDTVGFIRDLPHGLVASFRSTLEAALDASLILHVVDAADEDLDRQLAVTAEVLGQIEADDVPRRLVLNKCDKLSDEARQALIARFPDAWLTSAHDPQAVADLSARIVEHFAADLEEAEVFVPWTRASAMGAVRAETEVLDEQFEDEGVRYRIRGTEQALAKVRAAVG